MTTVNLTTYKVKPREAARFMQDALEAGLVPYLECSPGGGKSDITRGIGSKLNLFNIDHRLSTSDPTDLNGLPNFDADGYAFFAPFRGIFPVHGTPLPVVKDYDDQGKIINERTLAGWLLFFDEFPAASRSVQAAAFKVVLDRMIGQYHLHKKCIIAAAGNLMTDRSIVNQLSTAMQNRLIHLEMELDTDQWLQDFAFPRQIDQRIIGYLGQNPVDITDFRPDHKDKTFASPRSWVFLDKLLKLYARRNENLNDEHLPLIAGTIGSGMALKFLTYAKVWRQLVTVQQVIADPFTCPVPNDAAVRYATVSMLMQHQTDKNFKPMSIYVDRFDAGFRILFYRMILLKNPAMRSYPDFGPALQFLSQHITP